jgi:RHS repeat-associated protein
MNSLTAPAHAYYPCSDVNGNVTALISASGGSLACQYGYGPFGDVLQISGSNGNANPFQFSARYADQETGLDYYVYRYYNPSTGRWLSRDPLGDNAFFDMYTASMDNDAHNAAAAESQKPSYIFEGNNPACNIDPLGAAILILQEDGNPVGNYGNDKFPNRSTVTIFWTVRFRGSITDQGVASGKKADIIKGAASYGWSTSRYASIGGEVDWDLVKLDDTPTCWFVQATVLDALGIDAAGQNKLKKRQLQGVIPPNISLSPNNEDGLSTRLYNDLSSAQIGGYLYLK